MNLDLIKKKFPAWNKKTALSIGNNKQYKIVGCGNTAFKVLKFEPQEELGNKGGWSQVFWKFKEIRPEHDSFKVISKMEEKMGGK